MLQSADRAMQDFGDGGVVHYYDVNVGSCVFRNNRIESVTSSPYINENHGIYLDNSTEDCLVYDNVFYDIPSDSHAIWGNIGSGASNNNAYDNKIYDADCTIITNNWQPNNTASNNTREAESDYPYLNVPRVTIISQ